MRYFAEVAYLGTNYHGWQSQKNAVSVQQVIEESFHTLTGQNIKITGSGRTDTGVHAIEQVFHFDMNKPVNVNQFSYKLNALLPGDIRIKKISKVKEEAHARFDAEKRSYIYKITRTKDPFIIGQAYRLYKQLDIDRLNEASSVLVGNQDFQCFSRVKTDVNNFFCNVFEAYWLEKKDELNFHISANRFLRGMVRAIVGTLLLVGENKITLDEFTEIISSKDRRKAGRSVPAEGLFLSQVKYPKSVFIK